MYINFRTEYSLVEDFKNPFKQTVKLFDWSNYFHNYLIKSGMKLILFRI